MQYLAVSRHRKRYISVDDVTIINGALLTLKPIINMTETEFDSLSDVKQAAVLQEAISAIKILREKEQIVETAFFKYVEKLSPSSRSFKVPNGYDNQEINGLFFL